MAAYSRTEEYANLGLRASVPTIAPAEVFNVTVTPTLKSGALRYNPETLYKLFVRLPAGLTVLSVAETAGKVHLTDKRDEWTGGPDILSGISISWNAGESEREKYAYQHWLLAAWSSAQVKDTSLDTGLGWTISVQADVGHSTVAQGDTLILDATLIALQGGAEKSPLTVSLPVRITAVEPTFSTVSLPDSPIVNGRCVVAAGTRSVRVRAMLSNATTAASLQVRWQVQGAQALWAGADPHEVAVIGGRELAEFIVHYDFTQPVILRFSAALPGAGDWGTPFALSIGVVADLLEVEQPLIKFDAGKILLSCAVREPSAQVRFARLELSVDGGVHWKDITGRRVGTSLPLTFLDDLTGSSAGERDFSQGVYLRATDSDQRSTPHQRVRFDAASFLQVSWDGTSSVLDEINSGEALSYTVHLHCAAEAVLPQATISLLLAEQALEADPQANNHYWMLNEDSGEPQGMAHAITAWRGSPDAAEIYRGPLRSCLINVAARVRTGAALLHQRLPPATLTVDSRYFLQAFTRVEPVRAQVWRAAPFFQLVDTQLHTSRHAVRLSGIFIPPLEPEAALKFTVSVDDAPEQQVIPARVNTHLFDLLLDPAQFPAFSQNGRHSVQLKVRRTIDTRPDDRSSHSEAQIFTLDNGAAIFQHVSVTVDAGSLRLAGEVIEPAPDDPVTRLVVFWDGSGAEMEPQPVALKAEGAGRSSFIHHTALSQCTGALYPRIEAVTAAGVPVSQNLLFPTASGLLELVLTINGSSLSHNATLSLPAGSVRFAITVTSLVALPQKLNMFLMLGNAFSISAGALMLTQPAAGKGKVYETVPAGSWNGSSVSQLLQTEGLVQGASFSVSGTTQLARLETPLPEALRLSLSFTESDTFTRRTLAPAEKEQGVIFTAFLQAT